MEIRPYQKDGISAFVAAVKAGKRRNIVSCPTGTGKTFLGTFLALHVVQKMGGRVLWLAHRDELIRQPIKALKAICPTASYGVVQASSDEYAADFVYASVQTAWRENRLNRIAAYAQTRPFKLVVVDEAHHAVEDNQTYHRILEGLGCLGPSGPPTLGLTATVERGDGVGLYGVWEQVAYHYPLLDAIRDGYLAPIMPMSVKLPIDWSKIPMTSTGDFDRDALAAEMLRAGAAEATAKVVFEHAKTRKTMVFTVSIDQAARTAEELCKLGIAAEYASGETPKAERPAILERFHAGKTMALCNAMLLTEGYDEPSIEAVVIARMTTSALLYTQMLGRGTRLFPGKNDLLLIDVVGATEKHGLVTSADILGDGAVREKEEDEEDEEDESIEVKEIDGELLMVKGYLAAASREGVRQNVHWIRAYQDGRVYALPLFNGCVVLARNRGGWNVYAFEYDREKKTDTVIHVTKDGPVELEVAQGIGEDYTRKRGAFGIAAQGNRWRTRAASPQQLSALERYRMKATPAMTAGEVSDKLLAAKARARLWKHKIRTA